jgi:hypothetical protein
MSPKVMQDHHERPIPDAEDHRGHKFVRVRFNRMNHRSDRPFYNLPGRGQRVFIANFTVPDIAAGVSGSRHQADGEQRDDQDSHNIPLRQP